MKAQTMRQLRKLHHYLGVFFAPAILFFAFSGAAQTFRLTEEKGWGGPPPTFLVWMASLHKDQTPPHTKLPKHNAAPAAAPTAATHAEDHDGDHHAAPKGPSPLPLKIFVLILSFALMFSTLLGVIIALNNASTRRLSAIMLFVGAALPILLVWV